VVRLLTCTTRIRLLTFLVGPMNVIDLLAIIPWYVSTVLAASGVDGNASFLSTLRVVRLVRIVRVFKFSRKFEGMFVLLNTIRRSAGAIGMLFGTVVLFALLCGTMVHMAEGGDFTENEQHAPLGEYLRKDGSETPFLSIPHSMYWCIVTMTSVGYGEMTPIAPLGCATRSSRAASHACITARMSSQVHRGGDRHPGRADGALAADHHHRHQLRRGGARVCPPARARAAARGAARRREERAAAAGPHLARRRVRRPFARRGAPLR
jgi:hypothetical protein